ncbi:MAG: enamine deaminase RidA (YjgF/YER057c/UK114 family) [Francisellaceae bacterium]|jgi:enamine deaminase RidA (YjgF/YER057c/UK114 family)
MKNNIIKSSMFLIVILSLFTMDSFAAEQPPQPTYYQPAVQAGNFLYVSGQNAQKNNESLKGEDITQQTNASLDMIKETLKEDGV